MTDRYELTMLEAALRSGTHNRRSVFEVFARRLPNDRRYGVFAGSGRLLSLIEQFRFGTAELDWLSDNRVVSDEALKLLADYQFEGDITGYHEGELYFPNSPVFTVEAPFWEAVVLETLILSVLNYDTAVASAASRMYIAAEGRPLAEMGSRRASEQAAVAAARAAYIAGFSATSNLEAGRSWGVPTMGTAAHAFTLLHDSEEDAFKAQIETFGTKTTLLIDTFNIEQGVDTAIRVAGTQLDSVRIDSGDLPIVVREVRAQLDALGATQTRIVVTNDLDEYAISGLAAAPVDSYGVGTQVVTGSGAPTAGMVYKLVARENNDGTLVSVAKKSAQKADLGGYKKAFRKLEQGVASEEMLFVATPDDHIPTPDGARPLQIPLVTAGETDNTHLGVAGTSRAREHHLSVLSELSQQAFRLARGEPVIPTIEHS